jgi:hypothetical protein
MEFCYERIGRICPISSITPVLLRLALRKAALVIPSEVEESLAIVFGRGRFRLRLELPEKEPRLSLCLQSLQVR